MKKLLMILLCLCMLLPCALAENTVTYDENGNTVQTIYYEDGTGVKIIYHAAPTEDGLYLVEEISLDGSRRVLMWQNEHNTVRTQIYTNDILELDRYLTEDGILRVDSYDETGVMIYYELVDVEITADGYEVNKRFLPDGTIDHEWWWGPDDLYHEIWYEGGEVDFYTYWWYNVDGHDVKYEEHCAEYSKYRYYDYDANGEMVMAENETVLH